MKHSLQSNPLSITSNNIFIKEKSITLKLDSTRYDHDDLIRKINSTILLLTGRDNYLFNKDGRYYVELYTSNNKPNAIKNNQYMTYDIDVSIFNDKPYMFLRKINDEKRFVASGRDSSKRDYNSSGFNHNLNRRNHNPPKYDPIII